MVPVGWNPLGNDGMYGVGSTYDKGIDAAFNAGITGVTVGGAAENDRPIKPVVNPGESTRVMPGRKSSPAECETCKERKYQDGSNECNVSFQTAQHVSPTAAGAAVRAHEGQHVSNAYKKAAQGGGKVLQASVAIHTAICPECGRTYVSGGTTTTKIKYGDESNPYTKNRKNADNGLLSGMNFDAQG